MENTFFLPFKICVKNISVRITLLNNSFCLINMQKHFFIHNFCYLCLTPNLLETLIYQHNREAFHDLELKIMKKTYLFYAIAFLFSIGFSQTTIVTVDRANIVGPTTTGNDPSISSTGLTRGSGVALRAGTDFSSNSWTGTSQGDAVTNNDYMEWSTTANATNDIQIQRIDLRLRRNTNGPTDWQLFYSLDNFTTAGIAVNPSQTIAANTNIVSNITGLAINSATAGTITFRLYAWGAATNGGWLRVRRQASWSDFGIALPGIRLRGTITTTTTNSILSSIITSAFDPTDNINYTLYTANSGLTTLNSIKVGEFTIQDGGNSLSDTDLLATILTDLEFGLSNSNYLAALAIFDGSINIAETSVTSETVIFSGITGISALDDSSKSFDVYATFKTIIDDNEQIQLSINVATADAALGSSFQDFDAGGAQTSILGDDNRLEVIASQLVHGQQPSDSNQFEIMAPSPTVLAVDVNDNMDLDYNDTLTVGATGSLTPNPNTYTMTNGLAILDNIIFSDKETVEVLFTYNSAATLFVVSDSFDIYGPLITIAQQDFDGATPDWSYSSNVTTFDNGWGTDGYYGIINSASASPLDNPSFSNNIFGENDLNDEGDNGTTGFATLTFDTIDISTFDDVSLTFDWDVHGYNANSDDAKYRLIYDGVNQPFVFLLDGNGTPTTDEGTVVVNIPNSVNTVSLQVRVRNNGLNGYSGFDNFKLKSVFDGLLYVDDGISSGWKPSAPTNATGSQNAYVLSGEYTVGSNIQVNNFYINNAATTKVIPGQSITTNSGVVNYGTLELNSVSTSYSSLITDHMDGEVIYNRHVNQFSGTGSTTGNNDLISAPVTNASQTFLALRTANPDIPSGLIGGVPSFLFGPFDNVTNTYVNYNNTDDTSVVASGIGYRTASIQPTGSTFKFVGNVETGSKAIPITVGVGNIANLIGNPYSSYLNLSAFLATNNAQFSPTNSGVYGYRGDMTSGYAVWNQAYSDANPSAKIAPGQGFFVNSKTGGGTINFTPAMRTIGTSDDFISGRATNQNMAHLYLQIAKGDELYQTDLYFNNNASLIMDPGYDSEMFETNTSEFAIYSHLVENNLGKDLAVQSVSYSDLENVTIPLGINVIQGEQTTVSISESNIPDGTMVILEDNLDNSFTNLLERNYTFTSATTLNSTGRFYLHFSRTTLGVNDNILNGLEIYTNVNTKAIVVKGQLEGQTTFKLYDIQGRTVSIQLLNSKNTENSINVSNISSGIYIVELQNESGNLKTQKVIIR